MTLETSSSEEQFIYDAVILCAGGHTRLWKKSSSEIENLGDGYHLALKAGCELIDMEMTQFHPSGYFCLKISGTLVLKLCEGKVESFITKIRRDLWLVMRRMELSSRDKVAITNAWIIEGRGTPNGAVYLDISHRKRIYYEKDFKYSQTIYWDTVGWYNKEPMEVAPTAH